MSYIQQGKHCRPSLRFSELSREDESDELELTESIQDPQPLPEEIVEQLDLHAVLQQALGKLPPRFRSVVHLHFFGQLSFTEIGHTLKIPTSTAKTYVIALYSGSVPHSQTARLSLDLVISVFLNRGGNTPYRWVSCGDPKLYKRTICGVVYGLPTS